MQFRSIADLNRDIIDYLSCSDLDHIGLVVGIPRSGVLAGSLLALHANLPFTTLPEFCAGLPPKQGVRPITPRSGSGILLVDDSANTGTAMEGATGAIRESLDARRSVETFAVYVSPAGATSVDHHAQVVPIPRAFEWNITAHTLLLANSGLDIDGLLCPDPAPGLMGKPYQDFIASAPVLYRPPSPVRALISARLERDRQATEEWLQRANIQYDHLFLLDLPDEESRARLKPHAEHKARIYRRLRLDLFYESSQAEARQIAALARRPVYCTSTHTFHYGYGDVIPDTRDKLSQRVEWARRLPSRARRAGTRRWKAAR